MIELSSCSKQGHLKQIAQERVQLGFEYPQGWKLQSLSGQPVPAFDHACSKKTFFLHLSGISCIPACAQ